MLFGFLPLTGCAFLNRDNTPVTNFVEQRLIPSSEGGNEALIPLLWPVGVVTVTVDALVVHPASVVEDALEDTREALWTDFEWDTEYATECVKLPWRAGLTPLVFTGDFLGRAMFDIPRRAATSRAREKADQIITEATQHLENDEPEAALEVLNTLEYEEQGRLSDEQTRQYYLLILRAGVAGERYEAIEAISWRGWRALESEECQAEVTAILETLLKHQEALVRLIAFEFTHQVFSQEDAWPYWEQQLTDPNALIRYDALEHLGWWDWSADERQKFLPSLDRLANEDPVPLVRSKAAAIIRKLQENP